jgi:cytochrome c oxidase assembly protein subunit 15
VPVEAPATVLAGWLMVGQAALVLFFGTVVTGSGPHGGDPDVDRLDVAIHDVVRAHGLMAWVLTALVLVVMARTRRGWPVILAVAAQITLGYVQYAQGVPELLVGFHVLGATLVWIAVLQLHLSLWRVVPDRAAAPDPVEALA